MTLHPDPEYQPIPVKAIIPRWLGTRSQRINPWIPSSQPAATICKTDAGYELMENAATIATMLLHDEASPPWWVAYR